MSRYQCDSHCHWLHATACRHDRPRLLKRCNPRIEVTCELVTKRAISFIGHGSAVGDEYESAAFAAGGIVTPALFDALLGQAFYAPHVWVERY